MRVTSAFTRTIAVTTFASSAVWAPAGPAVAVAYPRLARWLARPGGPRARLAGPRSRARLAARSRASWPARSRARLAGRPAVRVPGQSGGGRMLAGHVRRRQFGQGADASSGEPAQQALQHLGGSHRVGKRAVARQRAGPEEVRQRAELAVGHRRTEHEPGERYRVEHGKRGPGQLAGLTRCAEEADVEGGIVRGQHAAAGECQEPGQYGADRWRLADHRIGDSGQRGDVSRDRRARVDQGAELRAYPAPADQDRPDFGDAGL